MKKFFKSFLSKHLVSFIIGYRKVVATGDKSVFRVATLATSVIISGCYGNIDHKHFNVEYDEGFFRTYVYTEIKGIDGKPIEGTGKLTICNGWAGLASDVMKNAAVVGGSALIGAGLSGSGDSSSTTNINRLNNSSSATATSAANAASSAISGANAASQGASPAKHHYRELKPYEVEKLHLD